MKVHKTVVCLTTKCYSFFELVLLRSPGASSREVQTMALLEKFKNKLQRAKEEQAEAEPKPAEAAPDAEEPADDVDDESWWVLVRRRLAPGRFVEITPKHLLLFVCGAIFLLALLLEIQNL